MSDGNVKMVIGIEAGKVFQKFERPMEVILYEPANLLEICEALATAAFEARDGVKPVGDTLKAELVERHRMKLTHRFSIMLNSLRDNKLMSNGQIAKQLVDTALAEVF